MAQKYYAAADIGGTKVALGLFGGITLSLLLL